MAFKIFSNIIRPVRQIFAETTPWIRQPYKFVDAHRAGMADKLIFSQVKDRR
jgi:hypothetical protein